MSTITFGKIGTRPYGVLTVTEISTNPAYNTSTVSISLVLKRPYSISSSANKTASCTINGKTYRWSGLIGGNGDKTLINEVQTITHNDDGTKTISLSASISLNITWSGVYVGTISGSGSMELTALQRYATSNQSIADKTETTISVNWWSDTDVDYIWYSSNNGSSWTGIDVEDGNSGGYTISELSPGTNYNIKTRVRRSDSQIVSESSAINISTYSYPYALSMPDFTIGDRLTIGLYNPLGRSITVNILGDDDSQISDDTTTGTSISGYDNQYVQNLMYASIPNSQSGNYKVKVTYDIHVSTLNGGTYKVNPVFCLPLIGNVYYRDINSTSVAITGNDQDIVRNQSRVEYSASGLVSLTHASINSCSVSVNGNSYALAVIDDMAIGGNYVIDSSSNVTATFTVTDSRGFKNQKNITINMLDWEEPTALINIGRKNNFYSETDITVRSNYSPINGNNHVTITYKAKKPEESSYSVTGTLQDNVQSTVILNNLYEWQILIEITDSFGGTGSYFGWVSKGIPFIFFDRLKSSMGINCFPQNDNSLEISGIDIIKSLYYKDGDTLTITNLQVSGMTTNSNRTLSFSVILPKLISSNIINDTTMRLNVRHSGGGYTLANGYVSGGYDVLSDSSITVSITKPMENALTIELVKTSSYNGSDNTPQSVTIESMVIEFG